MPTLSVGRASRGGVTLLEMLVVMVIIAIMSGVSYPAITSGIDSLRLNAAAQSVVAFLNSGLNRAERRQQAIEVTIAKSENTLYLRSADPSFVRELKLPEGVSIEKVLPEVQAEQPDAPRLFMLYPGATIPRIGIQLVNRRNVERIVQVDPMTGVPQVSVPPVSVPSS